MVAKCPANCKHAEQDRLHGQGRRVFNPKAKGAGFRCTVCGFSPATLSSKQPSTGNKGSNKKEKE